MIITPKELAHRWGCTVFHIYKLCRENKIPHFRVGDRIIRFRIPDIEKYECHPINASSSTGESGASTPEQIAEHLYASRSAPQIEQRHNAEQPTFRPSSFFVPPQTTER